MYYNETDIWYDKLMQKFPKVMQNGPTKVLKFYCDGCNFLHKDSYEAGFHERVDCKCSKHNREWFFFDMHMVHAPEWCKYVQDEKINIAKE